MTPVRETEGVAAPASRDLLVVVALPESLTVGTTFSRRAWPAHVTLASNFVVDLPREEVAGVLRDVFVGTAPLAVKFGDEAWFGPDHDIAVQLVESEQVSVLHERVADALEALPGFAAAEPAYWRAGYRPHMTHVPGLATPAGTRARLPHFAVAVMAAGMATVIFSVTSTEDAGGM